MEPNQEPQLSLDSSIIPHEIVFVDGATRFIGFYQLNGPTGYIKSRHRDEVLRFASKLIRSWPNTVVKKPYRDRYGNWIVKVKTK